jgi:hypothetical protein
LKEHEAERDVFCFFDFFAKKTNASLSAAPSRGDKIFVFLTGFIYAQLLSFFQRTFIGN